MLFTNLLKKTALGATIMASLLAPKVVVAESTIFLAEGGKKAISSERFNGVEYVDYNAFLKSVFPKASSRPEVGEFVNEKLLIKCSPGSFFVIVDQNNDKKIFQMTLPAISFKEKLWIPLESFLNIMSTGKILKFDVAPTGVFIEFTGTRKTPEVKKEAETVENTTKPEPEVKYPKTKIIVAKTNKAKSKNIVKKASVKPEDNKEENPATAENESHENNVERKIVIHKNKHAETVDNTHESEGEDLAPNEEPKVKKSNKLAVKTKSKKKAATPHESETRTKGVIEEPPKAVFAPGKNADAKYSVPENLYRRELEEETPGK